MGGSETLLPRILAGTDADIFVCHDPFEQKVKDAGKWAGSAMVGVLRPVVMVRPGNPRGVRSIEDLAKLDVTIGIGDPQYSTCGQMFVAMLDKKGLRQGVMQHVKLQARTHVEIANGAIAGPLDAVVVWNYVAVLYKGKLEVVETGEQYDDVRVTVIGLNQSANPALRDAFLEMCRSSAVRETFARSGYTPGRAQ
jgi:ABC-type molybdate transport system substrate-binding protein